MKRTASILGASLLTLAILVQLSQATQILYRSPKQLGHESSLVVRGKVTRVQSFWNNERTKIFTKTTIAIEETFKGSSSGSARVIQLGGVVDNVRMNVSGALSWRQGEEVLLFLEPYDPGTYQVAGFSQGKFKIARDPRTGEAFINRPALEGTEVLGIPFDDSSAPVSREMRVPLEQFINQALGRR